MRYAVLVKFHKDFVRVDPVRGREGTQRASASNGVESNQIIVGIRSKPEKGKANEEVIKKIARHFGVAPSRVRILSGARSKKKIIEIL